MPKILLNASYTPEGARGLKDQGGSKRRAAAQALAESVGGNIDAMYYALGDDDVVAIIDVPDVQAAVAASLAINTTGLVTARTTVLLTVEEMDEACQRASAYSPPRG